MRALLGGSKAGKDVFSMVARRNVAEDDEEEDVQAARFRKQQQARKTIFASPSNPSGTPPDPTEHSSSGLNRRAGSILQMMKPKKLVFVKIAEAFTQDEKYSFQTGEIVKLVEEVNDSISLISKLVQLENDQTSVVLVRVPSGYLSIAEISKEERKAIKQKYKIAEAPKPKVVFASQEEAITFLRKKLLFNFRFKKLQEFNRSPQFKKQRKRNEVLKEFIETEKTFCASVLECIEVFLKPCRKKQLLDDTQIEAIFSNIEQIYSTNHAFLQDLESEMSKFPASNSFGKIFIKFCPFLKIYIPYVNNYDKSTQTLEAISEKSKFKMFLNDSKNQHPLESLTIVPVQRIPRYKLLMNELLQCTEEDHQDYRFLKEALHSLSSLAVEVNERKRESDNATLLNPLVQILIEKVFLLEMGRKFLGSAKLIVDVVELGSNKEIVSNFESMGFLFNDMLITCPSTLLQKPRPMQFDDPISIVSFCAANLKTEEQQKSERFFENEAEVWREFSNPLFDLTQNNSHSLLIDYIQDGYSYSMSIKFSSLLEYNVWHSNVQKHISTNPNKNILNYLQERKQRSSKMTALVVKHDALSKHCVEINDRMSEKIASCEELKRQIAELNRKLQLCEDQLQHIQSEKETVSSELVQSEVKYSKQFKQCKESDQEHLKHTFHNNNSIFTLVMGKNALKEDDRKL